MHRADRRTEDWQPSLAVTVVWAVLGTALTLVGVASFAMVYALPHGGEAGGEVSILALCVVATVFILLLVFHEWIHGLAMSWYGARPEYGAGFYRKILPYLFCTAPGHGFTRRQFAAVSAAPLAVISLFGALCVLLAPSGGWLVVPLGIHLGGCIGDIWFLGILARLPRGTVLEDLRTGVRIVRPT